MLHHKEWYNYMCHKVDYLVGSTNIMGCVYLLTNGSGFIIHTLG